MPEVPVFDPHKISMRWSDPDRNGNVRYNIFAEELCIEDWYCKHNELALRLELLVENMYKVC